MMLIQIMNKPQNCNPYESKELFSSALTSLTIDLLSVLNDIKIAQRTAMPEEVELFDDIYSDALEWYTNLKSYMTLHKLNKER